MSLKLLSDIANRYKLAIQFHTEQSDIMWWLYLGGYAMLHEHQTVDEHFTYRRLRRYITATHGVLKDEKMPETASVLANVTNDRCRGDLTEKEVQDILKQSWRDYASWERETLRLYEKIAAELLQAGEVSAFNYVGGLIVDVKIELTYIDDKMVELSAMSWDMPQVIGEQPMLLERYEKLIRGLLGSSRKYHYHNSASDADSRASVLDNYGD